jgi:elongation factor Ts
MSISPTDVKTLRDRTNAPMMECKNALTEAHGDMEKAVDIIRKKFVGIADKRGAKETAEGRIGIYLDPAKQVGALVELRCESPSVVKNEHFVALANDIAKHVALKGGAGTAEELLAQPFLGDAKKTVKDRIHDVVGIIRENMKPARFTRLTGQVGGYTHHDGTVGVLVQVEGTGTAEPQMLRDVSMHITARNPAAGRREDIPAATLKKEQEIAREQLASDPKNKNKPANILDKIVEGRVNKWLEENVLVDQPFVKDDSKTVGQLLKGAGFNLVRFVRYKVGEVG